MSTPFELPLTAKAQSFGIQLSGVQYTIRLWWCAPVSAWCMALADSSGNDVIGSFPLVTGANLLEQFDYLSVGGKIIVQSDNDPQQVPTFTSLGKTGHAFFVIPD